MATSIMIGQKALCALPPLPVMGSRCEDSAEESIFTYELPIQLKIFDSKKSSKTLGRGLDVYKVSKNGIRQSRRVGISKDNQCILISTEKVKLGRRRKNKTESTIMVGKDAFKVIEISAIEKIVRGQITEKFLMKTLDAPTMNMPISEDKLSLSIVFRINNDIENIALEEDLQVTRDSSNTMATLDLVIPSHNDFELVISTIRNLMFLSKKYTNSMHRDLLLLRHHWRELNIPVDRQLTQSSWSELCCGRLSVPISKRSADKLYRQFCSAAKIRTDEGIPMQMALGLLEHTRKLSLKSTLLEDPCENVWKKASINTHAPSSSDVFPDTPALDMLEFGDGDNSMVIMNSTKARLTNDVKVKEYISAEAFLKFLHVEQKETDKSLLDVKNIFERLNAQTYASQLMSDGKKRDPTDETVFSNKFITKSVFFDYLHSDANDVFDPVRGELECDDMTQPLSCYWINASHDTYLKGIAPKMHEHTYGGNCPVDISMFTAALNRGSRCLEVDVWDGVGSQVGQPVVRFDDFSAPSKGMKTGLLFSDVMKSVRSFLVSQRASLPIILYLEVHCSVSNQNKMTQTLKSLLVDDDMIYIPSDEGFEDENTSIPNLPSPDELRGKVVLKFKIPRVGTTKVMCDDFDDVNDKNPFNPDEQLLKGEHDFAAIPGIESVGSLLFDSSRDLDSEDKFEKVLADATKAKDHADRADELAFTANVRAKRGKELAEQLLQKAGISPSEADGKVGPLSKPNHSVHFDTNEPECQIIESIAESSSEDETVDNNKEFHVEYHFENVVENVVDNVAKSTGFGRGGFMRQVLGWADTLDGSNDEGRDSTGTGGSFFSEDDSCTGRDAGEYDDSDEDSFDVGTFTDSPGHTMKDYIAKVADMADGYPEEESVNNDAVQELESEREFAAAGVHRSISNVQRKIANLPEEEHEGGGIEIQNIYSSALDYIVVQHKEAKAKEMDAGKVLATATSKLSKAQEAHEVARKELERHDVFEKVEKLNEDILLLEERVTDLNEKKRVAETAAGTAQSEYTISEARAVETAQGSEKASSTVQLANAKLQDERDREEEIEGKMFESQKQLDSAASKVKQVSTKRHMIKTELERISKELKKLEGSHLYVVEKKKLSRGALNGEGVELRKHRIFVEKQLKLNKKLLMAVKEVEESKAIQAVAQKNLKGMNDEYQEQCLKTSAAKDYACDCESVLDQYENYADEERGAADMRGEANKKAEARLANYGPQIAAVLEELNEKRKNLLELKFGDFTRDDVEKLRKKAELKKAKVLEAEQEFNEAQDWYKHTNLELSETTKSLKENKHILHKAKRNVDRLDHFANVDKMLRENALSTYERYLKLQEESEKAKIDASKERIVAAEAAIVARRAQDYQDRLGMMEEISQSLCDLVMFHSSKFVHFEKSLTLSQTTMHSISEGMMIQLLSKGEEENTSMFHELNKTHMTRIFPSRQKELRVHSNNFNPVLPWSLGCQIASINQQMRDAFVLVNDGRFRANGSCGYVLKPESMIDRNLILETKEVVVSPRRKWNIKILSGQNIPKPRPKTIAGNINPRVRVTLYDGSTTSPIVHTTNTVKKNGLNPVWNEEEGAVFRDIKDPDCAIFLFSVWDDVDNEKEDFLAAAAVPLSCMREGYRSIPLFDSGHMRCGAHAFTSLFVHAS